MARPIPFNRTGIFGIKTVGTPVVEGNNVVLNFEEHPFVASPYNGILLVHLREVIPTAGGTLNVVFRTGNVTKAATKLGNMPVLGNECRNAVITFSSTTVQGISYRRYRQCCSIN